MMQYTTILCPIYNDEDAFNIFVAEVENVVKDIEDHQFSFLIINDGTEGLSINSSLPTTTVHLHRNMGHQKAIAIGIAYAQKNLSFDYLLVMDGDGEDKPSDIYHLLQAVKKADQIIVANRISRQDSATFQFFYRIYKYAFYLLTGKKITFGNFMILPKTKVDDLAYFNEIWHHLAASIIKSKHNYISIETHRGKRLKGKSKMNFTSLLLHGLGAFGVFIETIASRLLILSFLLITFSVLSIFIIIILKAFTSNIFPGWTSTVITSMLVILLQSFLLSLFTIFLFFSSQGQRRFIPALHYLDYVKTIEKYKSV